MCNKPPFYALLCTIFLITGCDPTYFHQPELKLTDRPQTSLIYPIAIAVVDDEADRRGGNYVKYLITAIGNAYPKAVRAFSPDAIPVNGRVSIKIRVRRVGALFMRSPNPVLDQGEDLTNPKGVVADWAKVITSASSKLPVIAGYVGGFRGASRGVDGFHSWHGLAYLNLEIQDLRPGRTAKFTLPIAAERSTGNGFGYLQAAMNADEAWRIVGPRLAKFLDAAVIKIAAEESRQSSHYPRLNSH